MADPKKITDTIDPVHPFSFDVKFEAAAGAGDVSKFSGAFSEVSGLEATMEPVAVTEGGRNWGQPQLAGRTTFSTVILRRGMTTTRHLWQWFAHVNQGGAVKHRLKVTITLRDLAGRGILKWQLDGCLPVKLKLADLNATSQEVGIEELHFVHEGIEEEIIPPPPKKPASGGGS